jgi:hypothetical protein
MLQSHGADTLREFRDFLNKHVEKAAQEVDEQLYVTQFLTDMLAGVKTGEFGHTGGELSEFFKAVAKSKVTLPPDYPLDCPITEHQVQRGRDGTGLAWESLLLFMTTDVIDRVQAYRRKLGSSNSNLTISDLRAQMKTKPWFVPPVRDCWRQRFGQSKSMRGCWCIDLDRIELGLRPVSDEEFEASLVKPDGTFFPTEERVDPRRGELFVIVDALRPKSGGQT